jgi:hypothetical protein
VGTGTAATTDLGQEKGGKNVRGLNEERMLNLMSRLLFVVKKSLCCLHSVSAKTLAKQKKECH